jgi:hypothetical protein
MATVGAVLELRQAHPRRQGDIGEAAAIAWPTRAGFRVWVPLGHSPDVDLTGQRDDRLFRIQVKTSTALRNGRYEVSPATKGGNRSWSGRVKPMDRQRFEYLFASSPTGASGSFRPVRSRRRPRCCSAGPNTPPSRSTAQRAQEWGREDSNLCRQSQWVYSPSPLTTRTLPRVGREF